MKKIFNVLKGLFTFLLILILIVVIIQKFSNNKISIDGIHIFSIASESMIPEYEVGDVIISKTVDPSTLEVGDDVTYLGEDSNLNGLIITHRIVKKETRDGKLYFVTKGIANDLEDPEISEDNIYGKVVYKTVFFSFLGRIMRNMVAYYVIFIVVGVSASYEIIQAFFLKKDDDEIDE